jgi:hypothetical protein
MKMVQQPGVGRWIAVIPISPVCCRVKGSLKALKASPIIFDGSYNVYYVKSDTKNHPLNSPLFSQSSHSKHTDKAQY